MPYSPSKRSNTLQKFFESLQSGGTTPQQNPMDTLTQILQARGSSSPVNNTNVLDFLQGGGTANTDPTLAGILGSSPSQQSQQQSNPQQDYVEEFLKSMAANLGGNASGLNQADYEEALKNSAAQIKGAFGAEIGAIKASSANARHQTKRSKRQIRRMYNALGRQYDKAAGKEVAQGQEIANALQGVATNASGQVKGTSDQLLNEQAALAKGLGVESALPTVAATQQNEVAKQIGNIQQTGAREAGAQLENSGSQQRFLVRGGKNALLEGTNRRADLVQQLQAFLQENMGKIADVKGKEGQALAANASSVAKSFGDSSNDAAQQAWQRQKDLAGLLLTLRGQNNSAANSQNSLLPKSDQLSTALLNSTSDPEGTGAVIQQLLSSPSVLHGKYREGKQDYNMNAAAFADMVAKALKAQGYSDQDIAAAKRAAIANYQSLM